MGHETSHAPVAIPERVNPEEAMVRRGGGQDGFRAAQSAVGVSEPVHEARDRARADGQMPPNPNIVLAELTGNDFDFLPGVRV